jgi:hypothetical protein
MPLTGPDKKIMSSMEKTYKSPKKAKNVFYAMATSGKLGGAIQKRHGSQFRKNKGPSVDKKESANG